VIAAISEFVLQFKKLKPTKLFKTLALHFLIGVKLSFNMPGLQSVVSSVGLFGGLPTTTSQMY